MKKFTLIAICALLLSGCKVDMDTEVNLADIFSSEHKLVQGNINFEVPACASHEDSRQESRSLIELKEKLPTIFKNATFVECYKKNFNSFAHFTIPVDVGSIQGDDIKNAHEADVYIYSNKESNLLAAILFSEGLRERIKKSQKSAIGKMDFNISVKINKGDEPITAKIMSVFLSKENDKNKKPYIFNTLNWDKDKSLTFTLSDVAKASLFENGAYFIMVDPAFFNTPKK